MQGSNTPMCLIRPENGSSFPVGEAYEWRDLKEDLENDTIHFAVPDEELMKELGLTGEAWDDDLEEEEITQEMFGGI